LIVLSSITGCKIAGAIVVIYTNKVVGGDDSVPINFLNQLIAVENMFITAVTVRIIVIGSTIMRLIRQFIGKKKEKKW
jgi:hypothetical protein